MGALGAIDQAAIDIRHHDELSLAHRCSPGSEPRAGIGQSAPARQSSLRTRSPRGPSSDHSILGDISTPPPLAAER
jgi:hypothetical protein